MADIEGSNGQRTEFKAVGRANVPGRLSYTIATGGAKFGTDVVVPNMLHAKFLRSPSWPRQNKEHGYQQSKGAGGRGGYRYLGRSGGQVNERSLTNPEIKPMTGIRGPLIPNEAETEDEEIGAVVVAVTPEICDEALKLIKVEWDVLPSIVDALDGLKPGAPIIQARPQGPGIEFLPRGMLRPVSKRPTISSNSTGLTPVWLLTYRIQTGASPGGRRIRGESKAQPCISRAYVLRGAHFSCAPCTMSPSTSSIAAPCSRGANTATGCIRRSQFITPLLARRTGRPVRCVNDRQNDYYPANPQRYSHAKIGFKKDGTITAVEESTIGDQGAPDETASAGWGRFEARFSPFNTTRCVNQKSHFQGVYTNSGRNTLSQTSPFNWDSMTIAEQIVAEKLGMDPTDVALKNVHGPASQTDPGVPPSLQLCMEKGKKAMNWNWHPAGTKKLPDGRMHGLSFRYNLSPRHAKQPYTATVTIQADNKVYIPLKGPWCGVYAADACALVVAEELGAKVEDVILLYDDKALFTPVGGGSDGTTASAWVMKEAAVACKKLLLQLAARGSKPSLKILIQRTRGFI